MKNRTKFKEVKNHRRPRTNYLRQVCVWGGFNYPLRSWLALLLLGCQVLFKCSPYLSLTLILPVKWKHKMILYDTRMEKIRSSQILKSAAVYGARGVSTLLCQETWKEFSCVKNEYPSKMLLTCFYSFPLNTCINGFVCKAPCSYNSGDLIKVLVMALPFEYAS